MELKICPICNSPDWVMYLVSDPCKAPTHYIECEDCGAHTEEFAECDEAAKAWNEGKVITNA